MIQSERERPEKPASGPDSSKTMKQYSRQNRMNDIGRCIAAILMAAFLVTPVCSGASYAGTASSGAAQLPGTSVQEQEESQIVYVSLETRTHLVAVPAVISFDVVSSGGSGLYSYRWSVLYEAETEDLQEDGTVQYGISREEAGETQEEYSPHKEISVHRTGKFVVRVTVTDRRTGYVATAVTDTIEAVDRTQWRWETAMAQDEADAYYTMLMPFIRSGENPLKDAAFEELLRLRCREQNFTDAQITGIINILKHADPLYRDLYLLSFYEYTMFGMQGSGSGYMDPPNAAFVSAASSAKSFPGTFFHEAGHGLHMSQWNLESHPIREIIQTEGWQDAALQAGNTELEQEVMEAIDRDVRGRILIKLAELSEETGDALTEEQKNLIADALVSGEEEITETVWWWSEQVHPSVRKDALLRRYYIAVRDALSSELARIPYSNSNMVGDLYGGMTDHKLQLPYGHDGDYWYTQDGRANGMQLCEGWAEFFSAMIRKDTYYKKINSQYLPETVAVMERLAERLRDQYVERFDILYPEETGTG